MTKQERSALREEVRAIRAEKKRVRSLPAEERRAAKSARKEEKARHKAELAAMPKAERRAARRHDRRLRHMLHPVRRVLKGAACTAVCLILVAAMGIWLMVGALAGRALTAGFNLESETAVTAQQASRQAVVEVEQEGIVLLENTADILPLADTTQVNLFGTGSVQSVFGGGGSGSADTSQALTLQQGLEKAGFVCNPELHNLYANWVNLGILSTEEADQVDTGQARGLEQTVTAKYDSNEMPVEGLTDAVMEQAKAYSDVALVVISRTGSEGTDLPYSYLQLSEAERAMLDRVCGSFDQVVVLLNTCNTMELGWLEEYPSIQGVLWIGCVGSTGMEAVGQVLRGTVNPSGRTVDTYAYDLMDNPANQMVGSDQWADGYTYENLENTYFVNYYEGIYVGYRYYETRYAGDEAGYRAAVQYPFGYGLSYTDFTWEMGTLQSDGQTLTLPVTVTNTGDTAGKDVVQVYYSAPYYADRGIEKSAVVLAAFAKTSLLAPGQSETVTLSWEIRDMASYDAAGEKAYVLDEGDYQIRLSRDSHTPVDTCVYQQAERQVFAEDPVTGAAVTNRFDGAQGTITTLSRSDWTGTWPAETPASAQASPETVAAFTYSLPEETDAEVPTTGADNGLQLADLIGLDYTDAKWDQFLDQLTVREMCELVANGGYGTAGIERLGVPAKKDMDGPAAINNVWAGTSGVQFPGQVVLASTWNTDLAARMGSCIADEALAYGVVGWYGPAANLHRTAFGGRNFEYYSEDPLLSGKMAAAEIAAVQDKGLVCYLKHFALNEQENNRNSNGLYTWCGEQAIRELYLRPFEIAVKEGKPTGIMSGFNRIGDTWCGASSALLDGVLREEWGFTGVVVSDATHGVAWPYMNQVQGVMNGNDLFLDYGANYDALVLRLSAALHPTQLVPALRTACHNILYSVANSAAMS